jgi:hypothetical protein
MARNYYDEERGCWICGKCGENMDVCECSDVETGTLPNGLRFAESRDGWRIVAYAMGGYAINRWLDYPKPGFWCIDHAIPTDVEVRLCEALGIPPKSRTE